ncbi:MAG: carbohydrate ABC transporter permease [Pseudomonadota bacterium]
MTAPRAIRGVGGASWRAGMTVAVVAGLVFGFVGMIVVGVGLALATGLPAQPPAAAGALAGLAMALALMTRPPAQRGRPVLAVAVLAGFATLVAASLGRPFGLPLANAPLAQAIGVAVLLGGLLQTLTICIGDAPVGAVRRYDFERLVIRVLKGLGYVFFTVFVLLPFYVMLLTSFKSQAELLANPLDFALDLTRADLFSSYVELFVRFDFGTYIANSALVSVATVLITLAVAVPGAYAVARLRFRGRELFARSILLIYMVPAIVLVLPLYAVFSQLELRNSLTGLLIVYPATTIPVALYMLQGYFRGLPAEMEEAGLMDGLTRPGVIAKITLPLSLPALASVALYVFMIAWNEFLFAFMFLDTPAVFTLPRGVASLNSSELPRELMMAGAVITTLPVLAIFLWLERFMVQGLAAGAVKG